MGWIIRFGLAVAILPVMTACGPLDVRGSGHVVSEPRQVSGFDQVNLKGTGTLRVSQGDREALTIEAEDNILPHIRTDVSGSRLTIGLDTGRAGTIRPTKPIIYTLVVTDLRGLEISGSGEADVGSLTTDDLALQLSGSGSASVQQLQVGRLTVEISGTGTIQAAGRATGQTLKISGAGTYTAPDLASDSASVNVSGSGNATLRVEKTLRVRISGSGNVRYAGNASVDQRVTGSGSVRKIDGS